MRKSKHGVSAAAWRALVTGLVIALVSVGGCQSTPGQRGASGGRSNQGQGQARGGIFAGQNGQARAGQRGGRATGSARGSHANAQGGSQDRADTTAPGPPPPGGNSEPGTYTPAELQSAVRNFADQYRIVMANVADTIISHTTDPEVRRRAFQAKLDGATAIYDIAADPLPANAMLNSMVMVSLQVNMLKRHGAQRFDRFHPMFQKRAGSLQENAFRVAAKVMSNDQRAELLKLCNQWSQAHPDQTDIYYVRLNDLPGIKSGVSASQLVGSLTNLPGEFLNKFNPFAKTQEAAGAVSALAERMSWLGPRLMILAQWRAEAVVYESLAAPEVRGVLTSVDTITHLAANLPQIITQQREALFNNLQQNKGTIKDLLTQTNQTIDTVSSLTGKANTAIESTNTLTNSTDDLLQSVNKIVERLQAMQKAANEAAKNKPQPKNQPPGRPFDITEYTQAIRSLNDVVEHTNTLVSSLDKTTSAKALDARLNALQGRIAGLIWLTGGIVLVVALLIILAVKFIPSRRHRQ